MSNSGDELAYFEARYGGQTDNEAGRNESEATPMSANCDVDDQHLPDQEPGEQTVIRFCSVCNASPCKAEGERFGVCPVCHETDGYLNVGRDHWFFCEAHKTKWGAGAKLFSSSMAENPEQQRAQQEKIGFTEFRRVEPHFQLTEDSPSRCYCDVCEAEWTNENLDVEFGDSKLMGFCAVCRTAPCNANSPDNIAYFGVCPVCHHTDGYICVGVAKADQEIGKIAVLLCRTHKTCWSAGYKTFSSWRNETIEGQKALQSALGLWDDYDEVDPVYCSQEGMDSGSNVFSVHRITAKDLAI